MDEERVHPLFDEQRRRNLATRDNWSHFAEHRRRVTDLLLDALPQRESPGAGRLAVLGAGNANDLDLARLRGRFDSICLVDWDADAVTEGIARQGLSADLAIEVAEGIDLSGIANLTSRFSPESPATDDQVSAAIAGALVGPLTINRGPFEVAASVCLFSQIVEGVARSLGPRHARLLELVALLRRRHLQLLVELLTGSGTGVFVCDLVSSETAPQIITAEDFALPSLLGELIRQGNFFTGLNPAVIHALLTTDPWFQSQIDQVSVVSPWKWNLGPRWYAVYAIRFRRLASES